MRSRILSRIGILLVGVMLLGNSMNVFAAEYYYDFEENYVLEKIPDGVKEVTKLEDGKIRTYQYEYDEKGNVIAHYYRYYDITMQKIIFLTNELHEYEYDQNGKKLTETINSYNMWKDDEWSTIYKCTYEYADNSVIKYCYEFEDNEYKLWSTEITTYDDYGKIVRFNKTAEYDNFYYDYAYDDNGNMIAANYNSEYSNYSNYRFSYDSQNRYSIIEYYLSDGIHSITELMHNDKGQISQEIIRKKHDSFKDSTIYNYTYEYDEYGRVVKGFVQRPEGDDGYHTITYSYE